MAAVDKGPENNFNPNWSKAPAAASAPAAADETLKQPQINAAFNMTPQNASKFELPAAAAAAPGRVAGAMAAAAAAATDAKARGGLDGPLNPMTAAEGEGKLKRAMRSVKGRLMSPSLRDAKARLGKAAKATRRVLVTGNYVGEIIVAGERVRLNEEGFNPDKFYDVVSFHDKFFPNLPILDIEEEKNVFGRVFGDGAPVDPGTGAPSLPCNGVESDILFEGLKTRFEGLRNDTMKLYEMVGDTADVRGRIDHLQRLKIFIDALERARRNGTCVDFKDLATVTEKDVQTEEEIRALLRQFAFMILQARAPVPEYSDRTRIVQDFIEELQRDPVSEEEMNAYLVLWKEQAAARGKPEELPTVLGEVLDTTATQRGLLDMMLEDKLEALYTKIVEAVRADYQVDAAVLEKFNRLIVEQISSQEGAMSPQEKVITVVKIVVGINKDCWEELKKKEAEVSSLTAQKGKLETELGEARTRLEQFAAAEAAATTEKEEFQKQIVGLTGEVAGLKAATEAQAAAAKEAADSAAAEIGRLQTDLGAMEGMLKAVEVNLKQARGDLVLREQEAVTALEAQEAAMAQLAEEQERHAELKRRYAALEEEQKRLTARVAEAEKGLSDTRAELMGAEAEVKRLSEGAGLSAQEAASKAERIAELEGQIQGLKEAAERQAAEKGKLEADLAACSKALEEERGKVRSLAEDSQRKSEAAAAEVGEAKAAAVKAKTEAEAARRHRAAAEQLMSSLQQRIGQLEEEVGRAREGLAAANASVAQLQAEAATGSAEAAAKVQDAVAHRAAAEEKLTKLEADCEAAKAASAAALADRDRQITDLQEQLTRAQAKEAEQAAAVAAAQAAVAKKEDELQVEKAKGASGLAAASEEGRAAAEKLSAELEQLRAALVAAKAEAAAAATAKQECEDALGAAKKAAAAAVGRETEMQGRMELMQRETLEALRQLAEGVMSEDPKVPTMKNQALAPAFQTLLDNIQRANAKAAEDGKKTGAAASIAPATQICFMTHFITFFVKTLFFTHDMEDDRYALFQTLDGYVTSALGAYKAAHPEEGDERHILFKMLSVAFSLLHAAETLYVNKQAVRKEFAAKDFIGLQVLKQNGPNGEPDTGRGEMVDLLYTTWAAVPALETVKEHLKKATQTVFGQILVLVPSVSFNPPIKERPEGETTDILKLLHEYPSLTFLPSEVARPDTLHKGFTEVDMDNGFVMRKHNIMSELPAGAKAAQLAWPVAVRGVIEDERLSFADLFCIFVVLGRRYLISLKDDLSRLKCPLPAFLESPEGARAALQEDSKARQQQRATWATEAARKAEEAEAARKAAEAEAARKAAEEADRQRKLRATQWGRGNNLSRPTLEGGGTASNEQTLAIIFRQLKSGSTVIKDTLSADLKEYSDSEYYALKAFLEAYRFHGPAYLKPEPAASSDDTKHINAWMGNMIKALAKAPRDGMTNSEFLRKFLLFLMDSYIRQYRVEGAETHPQKITALLPVFEACLDIPMQDSTAKDPSLFAYTDLKRNGKFVISVEPFLLSTDAFEQKYKTMSTTKLSKNFKMEGERIVYKAQ